MPSPLQRADLLADRSLAGRDFCEAYTDLVEDWLRTLVTSAASVDGRWALVAVGGQGRRELAPQSDLDLLLLHDKGSDVTDVADALWYPVWDAGLKLGHAVRTVRDTLALAGDDLETATSLLSARHLMGDERLTEDLTERVKVSWRKRGRRWLDEMAGSVDHRHSAAGEVAFDLEPDLKDGRGGLRDVHALGWAQAAGADVDPALLSELAHHHDDLLAVRVELHRAAAKPGDQLLLAEQDAVAAGTGDDDADLLMARVAAAGRAIAWASDESWFEIRLRNDTSLRNRMRRERDLGEGLVLRNGRICLGDELTPDATTILRVALEAARRDARIELATLERLCGAEAPDDPWPAAARVAMVDLLRHGPASIPVVEVLDQYGLWTLLLPEWEPTRSLPQRNVFHRFTVDRHLLECSAEAASLAHRTPRPDLLVLGALLHDIGKGRPGDHSEVGEQLATGIARRMGYEEEDVDTIGFLVRHHLLLSDVATRRDLDDPATISMVADVVVTPERLALLRALSEADGLATGPTAWGSWKAQLVDQLGGRVANQLNGDDDVVAAAASEFPSAEQRELMADGQLHVVCDDERITVICPDRMGLFCRIAGTLSLHGLDVVEANVFSTEGVAVDEFRVLAGGSGVLPWDEIRADVLKALNGRLAVQARLEERARSRRPAMRGPSQFPPRVRFDNETGSHATVIEAVGPNRIGLLHGLTRALSELDLDVRSAKIHTMGDDVVDSFYVTDAAGQKVLDPEHQNEIRRSLLHVLDPDL